MNRPGNTRRRFIQVGVLGLSTVIAGCSDNDPGSSARDDYEDTPADDTEPDGDTNDTPTAALSFKAPNRDYTLYRLPTAEGRPDPGDMSIDHPDNTLFTIEVHDEQTATATLEQTQVHRDIELRLYVRDTDGTFKSATQPLESNGNNTFETHEIEFDISNINLPRDAGSICELVAVDPTFNEDHEFIIKRHQFVGIGHKNGVNWVNSETLNHTYKTEPDGFRKHDNPRGVGGVNGSSTSEPAGYVETRDGDNERTVFLVTRTKHNGEVFGVSCHIKHEPYNRYANSGPSYTRYHNMDYECRYATEISHLQELGQKTSEAISGIGVNGPLNRLQVLGDFVQMIPYGNHLDDNIPLTVVLYDTIGDCSNKSGLFSGIVQNTPWNHMPGFIDCSINGIGHWTIGIDVNDLGAGFEADSAFLVEPTEEQKNNGYPDTQYAFFDMTYDSYIGERTEGVEGPITIYDEGDFEHQGRTIANDSPNY